MDQTQPYAATNRARPSATPDGTLGPERVSRYGEGMVQALLGAKLIALADEGSYFVLRNPTPGTGLAGHAAPTTIDDTKPFVLIKNNASVAEGKRLYLDFIKLDVTAAGTNGTNLSYAIKTDTSERYSSGGSALTVVNPNADSSEAGSIVAYGGAVTAPAASANVRSVDHGLIRSVINVVGDRYLFKFGDTASAGIGMAMEGTAQANIVIPCPPLVIGPQQCVLLHLASASQSAASSHQVVVGCYQR